MDKGISHNIYYVYLNLCIFQFVFFFCLFVLCELSVFSFYIKSNIGVKSYALFYAILVAEKRQLYSQVIWPVLIFHSYQYGFFQSLEIGQLICLLVSDMMLEIRSRK